MSLSGDQELSVAMAVGAMATLYIYSQVGARWRLRQEVDQVTSDALRAQNQALREAVEMRNTAEVVRNEPVSEFFVAPCMCMSPNIAYDGTLREWEACVPPEVLEPGNRFCAGPRNDEWVVVEEPVHHGDQICVYAYRDKPEPLYHFFYFTPMQLMHRKRKKVS